MNQYLRNSAVDCLEAAQDGSMTFPEIVSKLMSNGFRSYSVDFRKGIAVYFHESSVSFELPAPAVCGEVSREFDEASIIRAIREAQANAADYSYVGFCEKVRRAGCLGYTVSFTGRYAMYFGSGEHSHTEYFPPN